MAGCSNFAESFRVYLVQSSPENKPPGIVIPNRFSGEECADFVQLQIPLT